MHHQYSDAVEDYLKAIYHLSQDTSRAATQQLASCLKVTPASVSGMLKRLAELDPPLVEYHRHHGARLTPQGELTALEVIRRHRLLELYLHQRLGFAWDEVHAEAERLEHVLSDELEERIAQALGDPHRDPHGEPIPGRDLRLPLQSGLRLSLLQPGQRAVIERVGSPTPELLRHLGELGLLPGVQVLALALSALDDNLTLQVSGQPAPCVLGPRITRQVFVRELE